MMLLWSGVALACAVCGGGDSEATRKAFIDTTIFLSLFPLGAMGAVGIWIWRRSMAPELPEEPHTYARGK